VPVSHGAICKCLTYAKIFDKAFAADHAPGARLSLCSVRYKPSKPFYHVSNYPSL
jgi:hypothetical protein